MDNPGRNPTTWLNMVWLSELSSTQKLICCYLRTFMNDANYLAWPSIGRISNYTGLSERCVQMNMGYLCEAGFLEHIGVSKLRTKAYGIAFPSSSCTPAADAPRNKCTPQQLHPPPATVAPELNNITKQVSIRGSAEEDALFDRFYSNYPKKAARIDARKAFKALKPTPDLVEGMIEDCKARVDRGHWDIDDKKHIPSAGPYIRGRRWEDEIIERKSTRAPHSTRGTSLHDDLADTSWAN